jgi:hypothetical protein
MAFAHIMPAATAEAVQAGRVASGCQSLPAI